MGAGDVAGAEHQGLAAKLLKIRRFGAKGYRFRRMSAEALGEPHQLGIRRLLERRHGGEQRLVVQRHFEALGDRQQALADHLPQDLRLHARQRPQVELQAALAADTVGVVAAVDAAEVERRLRHAELRIAVLHLPFSTQDEQFPNRGVHGLQGTTPQRWVRGVAAFPHYFDALHHHALVQADRPQVGRLADHRRAAQRPPRFGKGPRPGHGALLVAGGEDHQRLAQLMQRHALQSLDHQREEAFHVAGAEAEPAAVALVQTQRIAFPQRLVIRDRIRMTRQYQATRAGAQAGEQIELARGDFLEFAAKAQVAKPAGQQFDHRPVGLVERCLGTAHGRAGNQCGESFFQGRQWHGLLRIAEAP
ncbi:hypothetical protein D3C81_1092570 [compost metagenome]